MENTKNLMYAHSIKRLPCLPRAFLLYGQVPDTNKGKNVHGYLVNQLGGRIREPLSIRDPVSRKSSLSLCLSGHPVTSTWAHIETVPQDMTMTFPFENMPGHTGSVVTEDGEGRHLFFLSNGSISGKGCSWGHTPLTLAPRNLSETQARPTPVCLTNHLSFWSNPRMTSSPKMPSTVSRRVQPSSLWPPRVVLYGCLRSFDHIFNHLSISPLGQRPENMASTSFSIPYGLPKACHRECILLTIQMEARNEESLVMTVWF